MAVDPAQEYLDLFDGNIERAVGSLRIAADSNLARTRRRLTVATDAPIVIDIASVCKTYKIGRQRVEALKDVSLQVRQGEFVAITGTSGSGKSTLLQLIGGLDKPTGGTVTVDGHDIGKLSDRQLSTFRGLTIGFVFQFFYLQPFLRLQVNLEVPGMFARTNKSDRAARAAELAEAVGLSERLKHYPKELSGGQMQRAAIARALLNRPRVLLADEPTGNLDSVNSDAIVALFEKIRKDFGTTIIVVTHDATIAARADREIVMKDGTVLDVATPDPTSLDPTSPLASKIAGSKKQPIIYDMVVPLPMASVPATNGAKK